MLHTNPNPLKKYNKAIFFTSIALFSFLFTSAQAPQQAKPHIHKEISAADAIILKGFNTQNYLDFCKANNIEDWETELFIELKQQAFLDSVKASKWQKKLLPPNPTPQAAGQLCDNVDFENGVFTSWECYVGTLVYCGGVNMGNVNIPVNYRHTIMSGSNFDNAVGNNLLSEVDPQGGIYSCRLGSTAAGDQSERIQQTFRVTNVNSHFTYRYAVVLQGGHYYCDNPRFIVDMLDANGVAINCAFNEIVDGQNIPGLQVYGNGAGVWKDWSTVNIDLTAYIGQDVTIRFTTRDCFAGGHYGYAYIDGSCEGFNIQTSDTLCSGECITLTAPAGFQPYLWSGPGGAQGATTQVITTCLPGLYSVQTSIANSVCGNANPNPVLYYNVISYPDPVAAISANAICNLTIDFADASTIPNNINNTTITNWAWDFENDSIFDTGTQNPFHTYPAPGTYTVVLAIITANGCRDTVATQVQVLALNDPDVQFTSTAVCKGNPTQLTDQSTTTVGVINQWAWDFDFNGIADDLTQNPIHLFPYEGTFPVILTVTNSYGCVGSDTINVIVHPDPIANFDAAAVCYGVTTQFTDLSNVNVQGNNIANWNWNFGDGAPNDNSQNPSHTYSAIGTYTVTLIIATNNGCLDTIQKSVIVYPNPTADFSFNTVCFGQATAFNDLSVVVGNGNNNYVMNWDFGDGTYGILPNPLHTYSNPGIYNVRLQITTNKGCIDSITKQIVVHPNPIAAFTQTNVCLGATMQFVDQSSITNGNTIVAWAWDFDNNGSIDANTQNPTYNYLAVGTYTVKFTVTSNNGCSKTISQQVKVYPNPTAQFTQEDVCIGAAMQFTDQSIIPNGQTITAWAWDFENDGTVDNTNQHPSYVFPMAGTYTTQLTVTSNNGCIGTITKQITVHPLPTVTLNLNVDTLCSDMLFVILSGGSPAGGIYTGPGTQNGRFYAQISGIGTHQIIYTYNDANSCESKDTAWVVVRSCTGINEITNKNVLNVYPNPASGTITVEANIYTNEKIKIEIVDDLGKIVFTSEEHTKQGMYRKQINIENLSDGIYFVNFKTSETTSVRKIVKE